MLQAQKDKIVD
jgi:uncharacterized coiled-coil DUF342 family protein